MPAYFPATDPIILPTGPVGELSRDEYIALIISGGIGLPRIFAVTPGAADHANPDVYTFIGKELIQPGWKQASLTRDAAVPNASIVWQAVQPGENGNDISIVFTADGAGVHISTVGNDITVKLQTGITDANAVIAELALHEDVSSLVQATLAVGHSGAGLPTTGAVTHLSGGTGFALRRASLQIGPAGGGNNGIVYTARRPGMNGEDITIAYLNTLGSNILPVVTVTGNAISVSIFAGTTTAASVLRALWASTAAMNLVSAHSPYGDTAAGTPAAAVAANLDNGSDGTGVSATIGGATCVVTNIQNDVVVVSAPAIASSAAADAVLAELNICGYLQKVWMVAI